MLRKEVAAKRSLFQRIAVDLGGSSTPHLEKFQTLNMSVTVALNQCKSCHLLAI